MIGSLSSVLRGHQKARKPRGWNPPPPGAVGIVESPVLIELKKLKYVWFTVHMVHGSQSEKDTLKIFEG